VSELRRVVQGDAGYDPFFGAGVGEEELRKEIFFLAYHLHWSWTEIMDLDVDERRAFVALLIEQIERENAHIQAGRK
jgi:hypothetical protein